MRTVFLNYIKSEMNLEDELLILKTVDKQNKLTPLFDKENLNEKDVLEYYKKNFTLFRSFNNRFDSVNPQISDNFELTNKGIARLKVIKEELD